MRRLTVLLVLLLGCRRLDATEARRLLASSEPLERQKGASALQKMFANDAASVGDHGEAHWAARLSRVRGASASEALAILGGPQPMGGEGGGGGASDHYRLDDFWTTTLHRSTRGDNTIFGYDPPRRLVVHVDVDRPERFTGTWTTYFVNGAVYETFDLEGGVPRRQRAFHDSGPLRYERLYVDGKIDGTVVTRYESGAPEWEDTYAKGQRVGVQRWFYPSGKLRQEAHYANDKLDGRIRNVTESGSTTFCAEYRAGVMLDGGCSGE